MNSSAVGASAARGIAELQLHLPVLLRLVDALFADEGLLILDPRVAPVAALAAPLYRRKQHVTGPDVRVTAVVTGIPLRAGIDPYNILVDRTPDDNVRAVTRH